MDPTNCVCAQERRNSGKDISTGEETEHLTSIDTGAPARHTDRNTRGKVVPCGDCPGRTQTRHTTEKQKRRCQTCHGVVECDARRRKAMGRTVMECNEYTAPQCDAMPSFLSSASVLCWRRRRFRRRRHPPQNRARARRTRKTAPFPGIPSPERRLPASARILTTPCTAHRTGTAVRGV